MRVCPVVNAVPSVRWVAMNVGSQVALISKRDMLSRILAVLRAAADQLTSQLIY